MGVKRISDMDIENKQSLFTAIYGNITSSEFFIDGVRKRNLWQQLSAYLKEKDYIVLFYDYTNNVHSYYEDDLKKFFGFTDEKKESEESEIPFSSPLGDSLSNNENNTEVGKTTENTSNPSIEIVSDISTDREKFYKTKKDTGELEDLKTFFTQKQNKSEKVAYIIKNTESQIFSKIDKDNDIDFFTSYIDFFTTLNCNYAKNESSDKIFLIYNYKEPQSLIASFDDPIMRQKSLFYSNYFKQQFVDEKKLKNAFYIGLPDQEECKKLLLFTKKNCYDDLDDIAKKLAAENRTLSENKKLLDKCSSLTMDELTKNGVITKNLKDFNEEDLKQALSSVFCQEENTKLIYDEVLTYINIPKKKKPRVFLLAGTSGTGKTFTAKLVGDGLNNFGYDYKVFPMNEYSQSADAWKLLGSTVGHVGSDQTPEIFKLVKHPPSETKLVLVFDEIEKAHPTLLTNMMTLLETGMLGDGKGESHDFRNSIIFLTTNLAMEKLLSVSNELKQKGIRIDAQEFQDKTKKVLKENRMRNEICGRLDWLLVYNTLDAKNVAKIALQEIRNLAAEYDTSSKKPSIKINNVDTDLLKQIAIACKDNNEGARPVNRMVSRQFSKLFQANIKQLNTNKIFDIVKKEELELIESSTAEITIDEVVNNIVFEEKQIAIESIEKTTQLTLPSKPFFKKKSDIASYAKALGLIKVNNGQDGEGTGFLISPDGYILTCAHCIEADKPISFCFNGKDFESKIFYINKNIDIAILKIEGNNFSYFLISDSNRGLPTGTDIGLYSFPEGSEMGTQPSYTKGVISKNENYEYHTDAKATKGSSGGALFTIDNGIVYGVLNSGNGNMNFATDIRLLFKQSDIKIEFD